MSDFSARRRIAGRLLLGAAAVVALPLTASVSYAAVEADVQDVPLPPSAPAAPLPPAAPAAPLPPDAPEAPEEVRVFKFVHRGADGDVAAKDGEDVHVFRFRREGDGPMPDGERHIFRFENDRELTAEQKQRFEEMAKRYQGRDWEEFAEKQAEMAIRMAELHKTAPIVETDCDGDDKDTTTRSWTDKDGRQRIVICERNIERMAARSAEQALRGAAMGLRQARSSIASNRQIDAEIRDEILEDLDEEIQRIERGES
jgi:hypothetical protein